MQVETISLLVGKVTVIAVVRPELESRDGAETETGRWQGCWCFLVALEVE